MVKVQFLGPIARETIEIKIGSLRELSEELSKDESLREWLKHCAVAVNDTMICDIDFKLSAGDNVTLLPPVCGG